MSAQKNEDWSPEEDQGAITLPYSAEFTPPKLSEAVTEVSFRSEDRTANATAALMQRIPEDLIDHPQYEILSFLGAGGMGTVYKARHRLMDRTVVLKVINSALLGLPGMVKRFQREVQAAARLSHPNVVAAFDAGHVGDTHFLVMEFVEGVDLNREVAMQGQLPVSRACDYARQVALGLQHAFERGMVHRDLKPHNLMLTAEGCIKILDFGLARFVSEAVLPADLPELVNPPLAPATTKATVRNRLDADVTGCTGLPSRELTSDHTGLGTADYAAPEESEDARRADIRADIYSLGCTLYHLLAGHVPFPGGTRVKKIRRHREEEPTPLPELRTNVPPKLWSVIRRMMAKLPKHRYQTPFQVVQALAPFIVSAPRHILVVEDNQTVRELVVRVLEEADFQVTAAINGHDALERLGEGLLPDLILLDLAMPVMSGWEFLQIRQRDPHLAAVPVVIVTGTDFEQAGSMAKDAAGFFHKPLDLDALEAKVLSLVGRA